MTNYLPMTKNGISEGLNHQQHHCENLISCIIHIHCCAAGLLTVEKLRKQRTCRSHAV